MTTGDFPAIDYVMLMFGLALFYWFGFLGGYAYGVTKRPKPSPPPVDVDEETMQAFERHMEAKIAFEKDNGQVAGMIH